MGRKRGSNEGTIHRRSDGRWAAAIHLGYRNGRRQRRYFYGQSRAEVATLLAEALKLRSDGLPLSERRQTLGQFLQYWLSQSRKLNVRSSTYRGYESKLRRHIIPDLGRITLAKLTPQRVQTFLNDKLESGLSAQTVRTGGRACFGDATRRKGCAVSITVGSSTWRASASTCRRSPTSPSSRTRFASRRTPLSRRVS